MRVENHQLYPYFLQDYGKLSDHFRDEFETLSSQQRGKLFAEFTARLVPHTEIGEKFSVPVLKQQTHDEGIDMECSSENGNETLYIQSKYTIRQVDDLDIILSKFEAFEQKMRQGTALIQQPLLLLDENEPLVQFMLVTSRDLSGIISKFEKSQRGTTEYYSKLTADNRLHILDGPELLNILQNAYRKEHFLPASFELSFETNYIRKNGVYIGILSGIELKRLYKEFGNSLFLENVREYLGTTSGRAYRGKDRVTVNEKIVETLRTEPAQFLARNNGITMRASVVEELDQDSKTSLKLQDASIINGCQTTISMVQNPEQQSAVLIKIVQAQDSWDIAKASNFQNGINQLDLDLARYIRPQAIKLAASRSNVKFVGTSEEASAFGILNSIYQNQISYEETRSLFLGLFSRSPNNAFDANYTELLSHVVEKLFDEDPEGENTFDILFKLHQIVQESAESAQERIVNKQLRHLFQRFWKEEKTYYRVYLAILASCACVGENIYAKSGQIEYEDIRKFLGNIEKIIDAEPDKFVRYYHLAFRVVATEVLNKEQNEDLILKNMRTAIERASFNQLYHSVGIWADE